MADISYSNLAALEGVSEKYKLAVNKMSLLEVSGLDPLKSPPDIASNYLNELKNSLTALTSFSRKRQLSLQNYVTSLKNIDTSRTYISPSNVNNPSDDKGKDKPSPSKPDPGRKTEPVEINTDPLDEMSVLELDHLMDALIELAQLNNVTLDELLMNDKYADLIKNVLLKTTYIPEELKKVLIDCDSVITQELLSSILKDKFPDIFGMSPLNVGVAFNYLRNKAALLGIPVETLLTDEKYAEELKKALKDFEGVGDLLESTDALNAEDFQKSLADTYDGNVSEGVKEETCNIVREFSDYIADEVDVTPEELLHNESYATILKTASQGFAKTSSYLKANGFYSNKGVVSSMSSLMLGKDLGALGIDAAEQTTFKNEVDSLAKSKNVSSMELLTNNKYADDVKSLLEDSISVNGVSSLDKSKSSKYVSSIYKKESASLSQRVAHNIYSADKPSSSKKFRFETEK